MAKQSIGIGTTANDGTGDPLRDAFDKINDNFTELYDYFGAVAGVLPTPQTYTPTLFNVTNISASTAYSCQFMRVGNVVTVSGRVDVDATAPGAVELGMSLPIASDFASPQQCAGVASASAIAGQASAVLADSVNNRAAMVWIAVDLGNDAMYFTYTYQII